MDIAWSICRYQRELDLIGVLGLTDDIGNPYMLKFMPKAKTSYICLGLGCNSAVLHLPF